jgi:hypothetical protein
MYARLLINFLVNCVVKRVGMQKRASVQAVTDIDDDSDM